MTGIWTVGLDKDIQDKLQLLNTTTCNTDDLQIPSNWNVRRLVCVPEVHNHQLLTGDRFTELDKDTWVLCSCGMRGCNTEVLKSKCLDSGVLLVFCRVGFHWSSYRLLYSRDDRWVQSGLIENQQHSEPRGSSLHVTPSAGSQPPGRTGGGQHSWISQPWE